MSYTTILHIFPGEKVECGEELRNSWGSAPYVWDFMGNKYIFNFSIFRDQAMKDLWQLYKKAIVPAHQKAVLMMTFDKAYVAKENYAKAAKDIRLFLQDHNDTTVVNHWHHIAEVFESNPDVPAIGFWHTSVSGNPFNGDWDEEKEEYLPPNWDDCYEIYTELGESAPNKA
jgi:hypothetical protein